MVLRLPFTSDCKSTVRLRNQDTYRSEDVRSEPESSLYSDASLPGPDKSYSDVSHNRVRPLLKAFKAPAIPQNSGVEKLNVESYVELRFSARHSNAS